MVGLLRQETEGEFEIDRELGRGGMAAVYLATEIHLKRKVAIKVLPPELTFGEGAIERFRREAQTAAALDHPNIIPIYRISTGEDLFWYTMKYVEGRSLEQVLKEEERLSLEQTLEILTQIAAALDWAHERKVIHRDIKPANVMLQSPGRVIVTDFGIAKALAAGSLTASGAAIGTPYYMSPEQCMGGELSGAADQYSMGIMTYQMLSGQLPFEAESAVELLHKNCFVPPPPLDALRPGLPANVYDAVNRALAKKPLERFPSVKAFVERLSQPQPDAITADVPSRPSQWRRVGTRVTRLAAGRRKLARGFGALVVLAAGTGGAIWLANQNVRWPTGNGLQEPDSGMGQVASTAAGDDSVATAQASGGEPPSSQRDSVREPEGTPPAPQPTTGRVVLAGLPPSATVLIDGRARTGTSFDLSSGFHEIRMVAPGFEPQVDTLDVSAGDVAIHRVRARPIPAEPQVAPVPQFGVLVVQTTGGWARIYVDDRFRREGRAHRDTLPAGMHRLRLERPGYVTVDTTVTVGADRTSTVSVAMRRSDREPEGTPPAPQPATGRVMLAGLPPNATVLIDGQARTGTSFDLASGSHEIRVLAPGFDQVDTLDVSAGDVATHRVRARPIPAEPQVAPVPQLGVLVVQTTGGWARIYVDDRFRREGRVHRDTLPAGTHRLRLERPGYVTVDTTVTVEADRTSTVSVAMRRRGDDQANRRLRNSGDARGRTPRSPPRSQNSLSPMVAGGCHEPVSR